MKIIKMISCLLLASFGILAASSLSVNPEVYTMKARNPFEELKDQRSFLEKVNFAAYNKNPSETIDAAKQLYRKLGYVYKAFMSEITYAYKRDGADNLKSIYSAKLKVWACEDKSWPYPEEDYFKYSEALMEYYRALLDLGEKMEQAGLFNGSQDADSNSEL